MIRTLVTGYGYWGRVMTRNLLEHPLFFVSGVYDPSPEARDAARLANLYTFRTLQDALDFTSPQLVVICSPIGTQVDAALMCLARYANVLIAKPGATTLAELRKIDSLAQRKGRVATIDYTMRHDYSFQRILRESASWGAVLEVTAERYAVGSRTTAPILYDMMVHDIALLHALGDDPWRVRSVDRGEHHLFAWLDTDYAAATLSARTDAEEHRRTLRVTHSHGEVEWDQLVDTVAATPVQRSLADIYTRIQRGQHDMSLEYRVTATLEEIALA